MSHSSARKRPLWIALAFLLGTTPAAAQSRIAITPVTVVDVTDGSLDVDRTVLVEGDRIVAIEPAGSGTVPNGWTVVDGAGGYLIPGLWEMHTHQSWRFFGLLIAILAPLSLANWPTSFSWTPIRSRTYATYGKSGRS